MKLAAMNAKIGTTALLDNPRYIFEPKLDGYRALCYVNDQLKFISRNNNDITRQYPELAFRDHINAQSAILDGEIVAYDKHGNPNFQLLQGGYSAHYVVFDILMKNGTLLIDKSLLERKKILEKTIDPNDRIEVILFTKYGKALWDVAIKRGLEGIMAKTTDGHYHPGLRTNVWLKIKRLNTLDCVIVGFTEGKRILASLAVALYDSSHRLLYIGNVGTGFSTQEIATLHKKLLPLRTSKPPVALVPHARIFWVQPKLVAEVKYLEMTTDMKLRAPVFIRLRTDKKPQECLFADQILLEKPLPQKP